MHILTLQLQLIERFNQRGLKTTVRIANAVGVNQSCVYRALYGNPARMTKSLTELCKYAEIDVNAVTPDPEKNETLMAALRTSWDGTEAQAINIAKLLKLINSLNLKS